MGGELLTVSALGVTVGITFPSSAGEQVKELTRSAWSGALLEGAAPDAVVALKEQNDARALEGLSTDVTLAAISEQRRNLLLFHAGGIASGRDAIAFVGPSGRGKTTLMAALARKYGYITDETVGVDADLAVYPYRKPLSIIRGPGPKVQVPPRELGLCDLPRTPLRLAALVILDRNPTAKDVRIERIPFAEAVPDLITEMSYLFDLAAPMQRLASLAEGVGGVLRLTYAEASHLHDIVPALLGHAKLAERWEPAAPPSASAPHALNTDALDAVSDGNNVVVFTPSKTVHVLTGIAPQIWASTLANHTREEMIDAVVERYGDAPGSAPEYVDAAIAKLIDAGVLLGRPESDSARETRRAAPLVERPDPR